MVSKVVEKYLDEKGIELNEISTNQLEELFEIIEQKAREDGFALGKEIQLNTDHNLCVEREKRIAELEKILEEVITYVPHMDMRIELRKRIRKEVDK